MEKDILMIDLPQYYVEYSENEYSYSSGLGRENLKKALYKASSNYCMYCYNRIKIDQNEYGHLEHAMESSIAPEKLKNCIPNIGIACPVCNDKYKRIGEKDRIPEGEDIEQFINEAECGGKFCEQVLSGEDLQDRDAQTGFGRFPAFIRGQKEKYRTSRTGTLKIRDLVRKTSFGVNFAIIGIENQETIDYSIVLRSLSYDAGEYGRQYADIRREVRKNPAGLAGGEYLYGFRKDSRLYPVITFILYYGEEEWDGARDLHGILNFEGIPEPLQTMVPNYHINLVDIRRLTDTSMFHTDVRQVFDFIRYSKNPEKLKELVTENKAYQELEEDTYDLISEYTHAEELVQVKEYYKKDGVVNMCEALTILIENGRAEGIAAGRAEGIAAGRAEGIAAGRAEGIAAGRTEGKAEDVLTLLAELGNIPEDMKERILQETNLDRLNQWLKLAARAESVQEFEDQW